MAFGTSGVPVTKIPLTSNKQRLREQLKLAQVHADSCRRCRDGRSCLDMARWWDTLDKTAQMVISDCIVWHRWNNRPLSDLFRKLDRIVKMFQGRDK